MLTNAYLLAKIGADTAENEQHFAEILPKTSATGSSFAAASARGAARGRQRETDRSKDAPAQPPGLLAGSVPAAASAW